MGQCITIVAGDPATFATTADAPDACLGFVLLDASEYQATTGAPTLQDIFSQPVAEDLAQIWMIGFSLPLILWLSAWALGEVVNFINSERH